MSNEDDSLNGYWDDLHQPGPRPVPVPGEHPGDLVISTSKDRVLVRIHPDGTLTYGSEYTPDEAAVEFWMQMAIRRLESEERILHLGVMEAILQQLGRADIAHEEAQIRGQREGASEHDRFMEEMSRRSLETTLHQAIEFGRGLAARPNPPPPVATIIRPERSATIRENSSVLETLGGFSGPRPFVHRRVMNTVSGPEYCVCGGIWDGSRCSQEWEDPGRHVPQQEPQTPQHTFCSNCSDSPWDHEFSPDPHCQCGAGWHFGVCAFVHAARG